MTHLMTVCETQTGAGTKSPVKTKPTSGNLLRKSQKKNNLTAKAEAVTITR